MRGFKKEEILNNEWLKKYYEQIKESGNRFIHKEMPPLTYQLFSQYFQSGNRLSYEHIYFLRREYLLTFSLLSLIEEEWRDLKKLEDVIWDICDEYTWALPAHIGESEWNEDARFVLDLFACETAAALAEIITLLGDQLSKTVRNRARQEVFNRVINPFLNRQKPYSWENYQNNWCAVCGGSIGIASLYLIKDQRKLHNILTHLTPVFERYLQSFEEDGVCLEGLSYWTYGMSYYIAFLDLLQIKTGQKIVMTEKLEKIAQFQDKCYFDKGLTLSFSDGNRHDEFRIGLTHYLANLFKDVKIPSQESAMGFHSDHCYRLIPTLRDFLWTSKQRNQKQVNTSSSHSFESAQWLICKSQNEVAMAMKGGHNDEPHNHNDVGAFIYNYRGVDFITDLGAGEYTRDYFNENRYTIFCNQSLSHSVPIINKSVQKNGPNFRANQCILKDEFKMQIEFSNAYHIEELEGLFRTINMNPKDGQLWLHDEFIFKKTNNVIVERFMTPIAPVIQENEVVIKKENLVGSLKIEQNSDIPIVTEYEHTNHLGKVEKIYAIDYVLHVTTLKSSFDFIINVKEVGDQDETI